MEKLVLEKYVVPLFGAAYAAPKKAQHFLMI